MTTDSRLAGSSDDEGAVMPAVHYADVVEQLFLEYEVLLPLHTITAVAHQCARDLAGSPTAAMPELIGRLARSRLNGLVADTEGRAPRHIG
jgi:hypothetical protein